MSLDEAFLGCPLCCRSLHVPKLLPCLHIFCRKCLRNHADKTKRPLVRNFTCNGNGTKDSGYGGIDDGDGIYEDYYQKYEAPQHEESLESSQNSSLERAESADTIYENEVEDSYITAETIAKHSNAPKKSVTIPLPTPPKRNITHKPSLSSLDIEIPPDDIQRKPSITQTNYLNMGESSAMYVNADQASHQRATFKHWTIRNSGIYEDIDPDDTDLYDVPRSSQSDIYDIPKIKTEIKNIDVTDGYLALDSQVVKREEETMKPEVPEQPKAPPPMMRVRRKDPVQAIQKPETRHTKSKDELPPLPVPPPATEAAYDKACDVLTPTELPDDMEFPCPVCNKMIDVPEGGVDQFKTCGLVKTMQDMFVSQKKGKNICANCESQNARYKCLDCKKYLCTGCHEAHSWRKASRSHKVMSLSGTMSSKKRNTGSHLGHCYLHRRRHATHLCTTCDQIICNECAGSDHAQHVFQHIEKSAERDRDYIESLLLSAASTQSGLSQKSDELKEYSARCVADRKKVLSELEAQKFAMLKRVELAYKELVKEVDDEYKLEQKKVEIIENDLKGCQKRLEQGVVFSDNLLKFGRDGDLASVTSTLFEALNDIRNTDTKYLQTSMKVTLTGDNSPLEDVKSLIGSIRTENVAVAKDATDSSASNLTEPQTPPILSCKFQPKNFKDSKDCKPTGITSLPNGSLVIVDDINKKLKQYDQQGHLLWECNPPEHSFVDPWDVCITKDGNYAVTDRTLRTVKMIDRNGEYLYEFGAGHLHSAWGVACDGYGRIIVTDVLQKKVFVFKDNGKLVFSLPNSRNPGYTLDYPEYVTINHNEDIIVSDSAKNCIFVFDSTGRLLYTFGSKGSGPSDLKNPSGVCVDKDSNILIVDKSNNRVTKLSRNGEFIEHLASKKDGLLQPQAMVMTVDDHLVILDRCDVKVFRFTEEEPIVQPINSSDLSMPVPSQSLDSSNDDENNFYDVPPPASPAKPKTTRTSRPYYTTTSKTMQSRGRASMTDINNDNEQLYVNLNQRQTSVETTV